jgi:hypothetical protein
MSGTQQLATHARNTGEAPHRFCTVCGICRRHLMRGATQRIGVSMACIDVIDVFAPGDVELAGGKALSLVGPAAAQEA